MNRLLLLSLLGIGVSACDSNADLPESVATIAAPVGVETGISGTVTFTQDGDALTVRLALAGIAAGEHGISIHTGSSCAPADSNGDGVLDAAGAAMGHFDPLNTGTHGAPSADDDDKHAGDLGNVTATPGGVIDALLTSVDVSLSGMNSVAGRAFVVYSGRDDGTTNPEGNAGTRIGCGVIPQPSA